MSAIQNLAYSVVQVAHNFGAVATLGGSLAAGAVKTSPVRKKFAWLALAGWGIQAVSGAAFGAVSYYFYHQFPDISGIAVDALVVKIACASAGFILLAVYVAWGGRWGETKQQRLCAASSVLAVVALSAAAFLRWFS